MKTLVIIFIIFGIIAVRETEAGFGCPFDEYRCHRHCKSIGRLGGYCGGFLWRFTCICIHQTSSVAPSTGWTTFYTTTPDNLRTSINIATLTTTEESATSNSMQTTTGVISTSRTTTGTTIQKQNTIDTTTLGSSQTATNTFTTSTLQTTTAAGSTSH
ncbi:uncharacterized protein LOC123540784 [Mercenaria mercenaria]|uniref:uncharacterized protein LOC123540784 n=1 Tax=Mercenaria mercenaria TaxID=6596 RepID=UPI00234EE17A|nr:uncharacterized protein LOC123540784 [Mercenaria mercenaria]